ncbi:hypothetical protein ABI260_20640 [Pseudomonas guguanensis]|uniref:hypothetical protein n=1 Tax=Ectopseudomonas guguanensis TaxID=1198456 RepID=UPI003265600A
MKKHLYVIAVLVAVVSAGLFAYRYDPIESKPPNRFSIPSTVSDRAQSDLRIIYSFLKFSPSPERPNSLEDWDRANAKMQESAKLLNEMNPIPEVEAVEDVLGGVPVVRFVPKVLKPDAPTLIYTHGDAYVYFSAKTLITFPKALARATGGRSFRLILPSRLEVIGIAFPTRF